VGLANELGAVGVLGIPSTPSNRQELWEFLLKPDLPVDMAALRLQRFLAAQKEFYQKRVRRKNDVAPLQGVV